MLVGQSEFIFKVEIETKMVNEKAPTAIQDSCDMIDEEEYFLLLNPPSNKVLTASQLTDFSIVLLCFI